MKTLLLALALWAGVTHTQAQSTAFTYSGRLDDGGRPANGHYELRFALFDARFYDNRVGQPITNAPVAVSNGLFTVQIDFGSGPFTGADRWLEIGVRTNGSPENFVTLAPRQPVTPAPYALHAFKAGSVNAANVVGTMADAQISTNVARLDGSQTFSGANSLNNAANSFTGTFSGNGAGLIGLNAASLTGAIPDAQLSGNVARLNADQTFAGLNSFSSNVGIGTTTPSAKLEVNGTVKAAAFVGDGSGLTGLPGAAGAFSWHVVADTAQQAQSNTGYLLTNAALVTITLPISPNVGDVIRISSTGAAGWSLPLNPGQSVLRMGIAGFYGNWSGQPISRSLSSITVSADGLKVVATEGSWEESDYGWTYSSIDSGATWTRHGPRTSLQDVASSADGVKLVALEWLGLIHTSADAGATWTPRVAYQGLTAIASSADGVKLVTVDYAGTVGEGGRIYTSADSGVTWTARESDRKWACVACSADGTKLVAGVHNGLLYTSTDSGANWTPRGTNGLWSSLASSSDGSKLVAGSSDGLVFTSPDSGLTWIPHSVVAICRAVVSSADGAKLVVAGGDLLSAEGDGIYTSTDSGATWTKRFGGSGVSSMASSADGTRLFAVDLGLIYISIDSGITWTVSSPPSTLIGATYSALELQYVGNGQFLPLSHVGDLSVE